MAFIESETTQDISIRRVSFTSKEDILEKESSESGGRAENVGASDLLTGWCEH